MMKAVWHQYIERETGRVRDERLMRHRMVRFIYSDVRENAGAVFRALTSARVTSMLAYFHYDCALGSRLTGTRTLFKALGVDLSECVDAPQFLDTARKIFERRIKSLILVQAPALTAEKLWHRGVWTILSTLSDQLLANIFPVKEKLKRRSRAAKLKKNF